MKSRFFAVLAVAVIGAVLALPLAAQTSVLTANVPFEFNLAGKVMPAGAYQFQINTSSAVLRLRNFAADTGAVSLGVPATLRSTNDAKIIFNRYGDTYFLSSVVDGYIGAGLQAPISKAERELAKTASAQKYEILGVLARR